MRVRHSLRLGLIAAALAGAGVAALTANAAQTQTVTASGTTFSPPAITVAVGDTVHWSVADGTHTSTSVAAQGEAWDSGNLTSSGFDHTFTHPGSYSYYCTHHGTPDGRSGMVGKVVVKEASGTVSQPAQTNPPPSLPEIGFKAHTLRSSKSGVVKLRVKNPNAFPISGSVRLDTAKRVSVSARKRKLKLGSAKFQIDVGATKTVRVKLSKRARKTLKRQRKLKVNAAFVAGTAGQPTKTTLKPGLILKAPKRS